MKSTDYIAKWCPSSEAQDCYEVNPEMTCTTDCSLLDMQELIWHATVIISNLNWRVCSYDLLYIPFCSLLQLNLFWKPCSGLGGVDSHTLENSPLPLIFHMWWEFLASKNITESDNMAHNGSKFIMTIIKKHAHLEHILYYSLSGLTPCSRVGLERLTVTQQLKTFLDFLLWSVKSHHEEYCLLGCCPM